MIAVPIPFFRGLYSLDKYSENLIFGPIKREREVGLEFDCLFHDKTAHICTQKEITSQTFEDKLTKY